VCVCVEKGGRGVGRGGAGGDCVGEPGWAGWEWVCGGPSGSRRGAWKLGPWGDDGWGLSVFLWGMSSMEKVGFDGDWAAALALQGEGAAWGVPGEAVVNTNKKQKTKKT